MRRRSTIKRRPHAVRKQKRLSAIEVGNVATAPAAQIGPALETLT
ncbi:Hypothetical protein A7982_04193 [Minicystis rosea]|nr:Hypothetical protein A7982_04193 [Minicystis rosea]